MYVREPFDKDALGLSDSFEVRVLASRVGGMAWENLVLARHWRETDVLFCPSYSVPLNYKGRCVVATHSVNEAQPGAHSWRYSLTYQRRNQICARKADAVIVPSQTTAGDVERVYGVARDRISVVPEGVDDSFGPVTDKAVLSQTRKRLFGEDAPYLLFVGKLSERRNIPALLEAFAAVKHEEGVPHNLLLYGPNVSDIPLPATLARLGIEGSVVQINEKLAEHRDIIPIYSAAEAFVHPTAAEGFSLTIVEAMACGKPVITVGRGGVKEIVNGSALTIPEPTPEQLTKALRTLLNDPALRQTLGASALERSKHFRLSATGRGTLNVLRRIATS